MSDPFCKLKVGDGKEQQSKVINNNLNPEWNQRFDFAFTSFDDRLNVHCFDSDMIGASKLGVLQVPLADLRNQKCLKISEPLQDQPKQGKGIIELELEVTY